MALDKPKEKWAWLLLYHLGWVNPLVVTLPTYPPHYKYHHAPAIVNIA